MKRAVLLLLLGVVSFSSPLSAESAEKRKAFPDLRMKVEKELVDSDYVTVLWSGEGTNTGEGNGLPATGKKLKGRGMPTPQQ